ncbi:hypothetical+protein [Methylocapsa aurea]
MQGDVGVIEPARFFDRGRKQIIERFPVHG